MVSFEEERPEKPLEHRVGEDLAKLSVDELGKRIELLKAEIRRIETTMAEKQASRETAASFFKR